MRLRNLYASICLLGMALLAFTVAANAYAGDGDIVISEVSYNATCLGTDPSICGNTGSTENRFEWLEIYNKGSSSVNINSWQLCDNNGCDSLPDKEIGTGEYWVIAYNTTALQTEFNQYSPAFTVNTAKTIALNSQLGGSYGLANSKDRVYLLNASGLTVDCVSWGSPGAGCGAEGVNTSLHNAQNGQSITNIQGQWVEHGPSDAAQQASPYLQNTAVSGSPTAITVLTFSASNSTRRWPVVVGLVLLVVAGFSLSVGIRNSVRVTPFKISLEKSCRFVSSGAAYREKGRE